MMLSDVSLSDVCLSVAYIGPKSRTERPRKTKIGTEITHVTRDWDTTFKVKRSKVKGVLLTAALMRQAAAAVNVGTVYWAWESTATLPYAGTVSSGRRGARRPQREERGGGILWQLPHNLFVLACFATECTKAIFNRAIHPWFDCFPSVLWHYWLGGRKVKMLGWWFVGGDDLTGALHVTTASVILSSNKIQNGDILVLVPAYRGCPGKWPLNEGRHTAVIGYWTRVKCEYSAWFTVIG